MSDETKRSPGVPLGVFGASTAPPPPPAAVPAPAAAPAAVPAEAADAAHSAAPAPAERQSFPSTLVGVPSVSPEAVEKARTASFVAPPPWQGVAAYQSGAPPLRESGPALEPPGAQPPPPPPVSTVSARTAPAESRNAAARPPAAPPPPQVLARVNLRPAGTVAAGAAERPAPSPVSAPTPALDSDEVELDLSEAFDDAPTPSPQDAAAAPPESARGSSVPPVIIPEYARRDPSEVDIPLHAAASPGPVAATAEPRQPAAAARREPTSDGASSVDPGAPLLGAMFVAAMLVLGVGGWLLTQGGFVPAPHPKKSAAPTRASGAAAARAPEQPEPQPKVDAPETPTEETLEALAAEEPPFEDEAEDEEDDDGTDAVDGRRARRLERLARKARALREDKRAQPPSVAPSAVAPVLAGPVEPQLTITKSASATEAPVAPPAAPARREGELPETLSRDEVLAGLDGVRAAVQKCAAGKHGVAEVDLTILDTGDVSHVVVTGDFSGSAEGSCIARVVRGARFGAFKKPRFRLIYPFQL